MIHYIWMKSLGVEKAKQLVFLFFVMPLVFPEGFQNIRPTIQYIISKGVIEGQLWNFWLERQLFKIQQPRIMVQLCYA